MAEAKPKAQQLEGNRCKEAEFLRTAYVATAHANTQPEDLLDPQYFAHVAERLKAWDRIEVRADDGTWFAELLVLESARNWARVKILSSHSLTGEISAVPGDELNPYLVKNRGAHSKWSVIRKSDNAVVHEGEETKDGAQKWLTERMKAER